MIYQNFCGILVQINEFILFIFYLLIKAGQKPAFNHIEEQNYLEFIEIIFSYYLHLLLFSTVLKLSISFSATLKNSI